jgi:hypothetical protein
MAAGEAHFVTGKSGAVPMSASDLQEGMALLA